MLLRLRNNSVKEEVRNFREGVAKVLEQAKRHYVKMLKTQLDQFWDQRNTFQNYQDSFMQNLTRINKSLFDFVQESEDITTKQAQQLKGVFQLIQTACLQGRYLLQDKEEIQERLAAQEKETKTRNEAKQLEKATSDNLFLLQKNMYLQQKCYELERDLLFSGRKRDEPKSSKRPNELLSDVEYFDYVLSFQQRIQRLEETPENSQYLLSSMSDKQKAEIFFQTEFEIFKDENLQILVEEIYIDQSTRKVNVNFLNLEERGVNIHGLRVLGSDLPATDFCLEKFAQKQVSVSVGLKGD